MKNRMNTLWEVWERMKVKFKEQRERISLRLKAPGKSWYKLSQKQLSDKKEFHVRRQRNIFAAYFMLVFILIAAAVVGQGQRAERIQFEPLDRQVTGVEEETETGKASEESKKSAQSSLSQGIIDLDLDKGVSVPASQAETLDSISWPVTGKITVRFHEVYSHQNQYRLHDGVDIQASAGQEVKAALGGKVKNVETDPILGETIILSHNGDIETIYGNLAEIKVVPGDIIEKGQVIASVGDTARLDASQGYFLHFGLRVEDQYRDPQEFLP